MWDEIASKNTTISSLTENINNLSRSHSQSETCYQPQKHNKAQNTQVLLDDQPLIVSRNKAKEKDLRKPSYENLISPNRFELLGCGKNENENVDHREKYKPFNQIDFKVTQPSVSEKSSLNSNASIVKTLYVGNLNKNVTEQDLIELFGLRTTNYLRNTCRVKLILCSKTNNSRGFAFVTGPEYVLNELVKLNGIEFQEKLLVIEKAKNKYSTPSLTSLRQIQVDVSQKSQRRTAFYRTPVVSIHEGFSYLTSQLTTFSFFIESSSIHNFADDNTLSA